MKWKEEDLPALKELESAMLKVWKRNSETTDHVATRAYEAAHHHYRAIARGHAPKPTNPSGLDAVASEALMAACEKLLTSGSKPAANKPAQTVQAVPVAKLAEYLRELQRSVERHTRMGGRQGYFQFLNRYVD